MYWSSFGNFIAQIIDTWLDTDSCKILDIPLDFVFQSYSLELVTDIEMVVE